MALSPADFAAYSRATGTPYPEDPEERAQMVPEVLEFRRNQLRSQQEESNLPGILGAVAAGLGVLGAGALGARRLARQPKAQTKLGVNVADLSQVSTTKASNTPPPSRIPDPWGSTATVPTAIPQATVDLNAVRSRSVIPTEEESFQQYISQLKRDIPEPTAKELEFPAASPTTYVMGTGDEEYVPYRADPREFAVSPEVAAARREDAAQRLLLAARQRQENPALSFQTLSALESGEDQMTGRIMRGVQRNEDLDSSQVNEIFRQTGNAELAASLTPDGVPLDQVADVTYKIQPKQFELPGARIQEQAARVKRWNEPIGVSVIGRYPALPEDPNVMGRFPGALGTSASAPVLYTPANTNVSNVMRRAGVEFSPVQGMLTTEGITKPARYTVLPRGTTTEALTFQPASQSIPLSEEAALSKIQEYQTSRQAQLESAASRGISPARAQRNLQVTETQRAAIERLLPTYSPEDVLSRAAGVMSYGDIGEAERYTQEMASKSGRLQSMEQGGFLAEQVDPGQLRQEPAQVRPGVMIRPASRTSYRGITGRPGQGIYGEELGGVLGETSFGPAPVLASKEIITEGESRGITTPRKFTSGLDLPEYRTPEDFVYSEEALQQPTYVPRMQRGTGLENKSDEAVGMMSLVGDRTQREAATAELTRRDPQFRQERIDRALVAEDVRRLATSTRPSDQQLLNQYLDALRGKF